MVAVAFEALIDAIAERVADILLERTPPASDGYLTISGAADYLGVSEDAIRGYVKRRQIPAYRPNGRVFVSKADLDAWVKGEA